MPNRKARRQRERELKKLQTDARGLGVNWAALKRTAERTPATIDTCFETVVDGLEGAPMLPGSPRQRIFAAYKEALAELKALERAKAKAVEAAAKQPRRLIE